MQRNVTSSHKTFLFIIVGCISVCAWKRNGISR